ncbi:acetate--CoA ligase [Thermoflexus sp.]|uniref:acetate--CoA ligase n=1 Tax=Thermoflexus sp. TaxID=1969742 RepID=UPI0017B532ED|nr:acetate--CoA ligase [Thermoflexus sp.]
MKELNLQITWRPDPQTVEHSNVLAQMRRLGFPSYEAFLEWSFADPAGFWKAFFEDTGFRWRTPYRETVDLSRGAPWAQWFVGGTLNATENALDRHLEAGRGDRLALIWEGEEGEIRRYTYRQVFEEVARLARALQAMGAQPGDRIGLFLPMIPEVAFALLAAMRIGAIVIPLFSGFGPEAVAVRLQDAGARFLITADGFPRRGRIVPMKEIADEALQGAPGVEKTLVVRRAGNLIPWHEGRDQWLHEITAPHSPGGEAPAFPSETPFMIIYTSGTTGRPKGTVHVHGGAPIKAAQDMYHLFDLKPDDLIHWVTDIGWMMGPWLILGSLTLGAACFLYDGAPDYPEPDRLWSMVERHGVTILGISPTLIRAMMRYGEEWPDRHPMPSLRLLGSTGEPWNPEPWLWTFRHVGKERCPIINYSGGTEVFGGILGCTVVRPLKPCSFNTVVPGVQADCVDEEGKPVREEVGLLVIRNVNPGMTRSFWGDPDRYLETYWSRFEGMWYHGDLVYIDEDGFWYILGRADDTLKVGGKRLGPAEMESVLVEHPAVAEAAVIGVPDEIRGEVPVAFVVLRPGHEPDETLRAALIEHVAHRMGKALAPKEVRFVRDIPKTRNAKLMRRVIRAIYLGRDPGDLSALENPQAVEEIRRAR